MSWMWAVELIPLSIRGPANAMATAANWLMNFVVVIVTPPLFANTLWRTYILYACTNFAIIPIIYFFIPETGSRSLEEVDMLFKAATEKGNPWLSVVKAAREEPRWFDKNGDPTDSYGSSSGKSQYDSAEKGERGSTSNGDHESPDPLWRNPSETRQTRISASSDEWERRGPAPAPAIRRTHSDDRTGQRSAGSRGTR